MSDRYRPVVAIEVDGLLERPVLQMPASSEVIEMEITMRRSVYPTATRAEPKWDAAEEWCAVHWFSQLGVNWVRRVLAEGAEVVWASTWREYANVYFSDPLGLPHLPVGVRLDHGRHADILEWKMHQLAASYAARPLLWITDQLPPSGGRALAALRNPRDRFLTAVHLISFTSWVSEGDVQRMDRWLQLVRTEEGHQELRRLRRRYQDQARQRQREREAGG